ncbi:MAG: 50S ribosomal protein L21 [Clostridium sp.]
MYAIIEACGRQYKVENGSIVYFEKLDAEEGKKVTFDKVLLISDKETSIGAPYIKGVKVEGKVVSHVKGEKIRIFKYKPKKGYRKRQGHRQNYTKVEITKISLPKQAKETK